MHSGLYWSGSALLNSLIDPIWAGGISAWGVLGAPELIPGAGCHTSNQTEPAGTERRPHLP